MTDKPASLRRQRQASQTARAHNGPHGASERKTAKRKLTAASESAQVNPPDQHKGKYHGLPPKRRYRHASRTHQQAAKARIIGPKSSTHGAYGMNGDVHASSDVPDASGKITATISPLAANLKASSDDGQHVLDRIIFFDNPVQATNRSARRRIEPFRRTKYPTTHGMRPANSGAHGGGARRSENSRPGRAAARAPLMIAIRTGNARPGHRRGAHGPHGHACGAYCRRASRQREVSYARTHQQIGMDGPTVGGRRCAGRPLWKNQHVAAL